MEIDTQNYVRTFDKPRHNQMKSLELDIISPITEPVGSPICVKTWELSELRMQKIESLGMLDRMNYCEDWLYDVPNKPHD